MHQITVKSEHQIGDIVYLRTDAEQSPHIVVGIVIISSGLMFDLKTGAKVSTHYDYEITKDKDQSMVLGI